MTDTAPEFRFLSAYGWSEAARLTLAGDASARRYLRLRRGSETAVLMIAPAASGEDTERFARVARWLADQGFSSPRVLAEDHPNGFLLLEDLGDALLARLTAADPAQEDVLYAAAADFLVELGRCPVPDWLTRLDADALGALTALLGDWYLPDRDEVSAVQAAVTETCRRLVPEQFVFCLRDCHAENLIWLPDRVGPARLGLLDFQDAVAAHPAYDLVSLLQDARRDVGPATERALKIRVAEALGEARTNFDAAYAALGAQRALRILAIFARLALRDGKTRYLDLIPRVRGQLERNLTHPALADLARMLASTMPPAEGDVARLRALCR